MVVIAMKNIDYLFCSFAFRDPMENKAMGHVFKKTPEKYTAQKSKDDPPGCEARAGATVIQHIDHNRQIHSPDHQRMCFGQHFQVRIFEKLGLPFIMNFFEFHGTKIRMVNGEK